MESTRLLAGIREVRVREHVRRYFNPDGFDPKGFRDVMMLGLIGLLLSELVVYILLQQSADLGELPHNIADLLIVAISLLEFLMVPLISWLGSRRRRSMLMGANMAALISTIPLFALPDPAVTADAGLCSAVAPHSFFTIIPATAAVRLSLLLISGLVCALARAAYISHGLAYLVDYNPSDNLHMHVGIFILHRVTVYLLGSSMKKMTLDKPWLQMTIITIKCLITLLRLLRYSEVAPEMEKLRGNDRGLFSSIRRVVGNGVAVLQILAMSLLAAAWWGFGTQESAFIQVKYYIRPDNDSDTGMINMNIRVMSVILGVILAGYIYTAPVMPKFDRRAALGSAGRMSFIAALLYVLMTALLRCNRNDIAGLADRTYSPPACGLNCGCDRPWVEFTPVCVPEQMATYFSPCHAGCGSSETINGIGVFSNCTCAPGGRVTIGACDDGSCAGIYSLHQLMYVLVALASTLAFVWQTTVVLESVEKRDTAVAVGIASSVVSLFTFVGAHMFYMGISFFTCAFSVGSKCLLQNDLLAPWVGYTSAVLAALSLVITIISCLILRRQKEEAKEEDLSL